MRTTKEIYDKLINVESELKRMNTLYFDMPDAENKPLVLKSGEVATNGTTNGEYLTRLVAEKMLLFWVLNKN